MEPSRQRLGAHQLALQHAAAAAPRPRSTIHAGTHCLPPCFLSPSPCPQSRRSTVVVQAAARPLWQPGQPAPAHLDGSMPGDYGFGELAGRSLQQ